MATASSGRVTMGFPNWEIRGACGEITRKYLRLRRTQSHSLGGAELALPIARSAARRVRSAFFSTFAGCGSAAFRSLLRHGFFPTSVRPTARLLSSLDEPLNSAINGALQVVNLIEQFDQGLVLTPRDGQRQRVGVAHVGRHSHVVQLIAVDTGVPNKGSESGSSLAPADGRTAAEQAVSHDRGPSERDQAAPRRHKVPDAGNQLRPYTVIGSRPPSHRHRGRWCRGTMAVRSA